MIIITERLKYRPSQSQILKSPSSTPKNQDLAREQDGSQISLKWMQNVRNDTIKPSNLELGYNDWLKLFGFQTNFGRFTWKDLFRIRQIPNPNRIYIKKTIYCDWKRCVMMDHQESLEMLEKG